MSIINTIKGMLGKKRTVEKAGYTEKVKKSGVPFVLDNSLIGELKEGDLVAGRYTILNVMKGGMGVVYPAYDNALMQVFAIKTFQERFLWNQNIINGFIREAEVWMNLDEHPNITRAMSIQKDHGIPYIILEYVDGGDLSKWIGNLDIPQAINFAVQICNGMAYAYDKLRLVHRDLKPHNILITGEVETAEHILSRVRRLFASAGDSILKRHCDMSLNSLKEYDTEMARKHRRLAEYLLKERNEWEEVQYLLDTMRKIACER